MGKKSGPSAPDPAATAAAQSAANKEAVTESAKVNQINQNSPYGSVSYSGEIGSPNRTQTTTLSGSGQRQLDQQNQVAEGLGNKALDIYGQLPTDKFSYDGFQQVPTDYNALRQQASEKVYGDLTHNLNRDFDRSDETLRSKLAAQGLSQDSEAFKREMEAASDSKNTALSNASLQAYQSGLGEANNAYNQASANRTRQAQEALTVRQNPMNELSSILQGTPAFQSQQTPNVAQYNVPAPDVAGLVNSNYQNQLAQSNQRANKLGSTIGNLGSIGATLYSSASELKENKEPLSDSILDKLVMLPIEFWNYKPATAAAIRGDNGNTHIGPYAGDFKEIFGVGDGMTLNIVDLFGVVMQSIKELALKVEELNARK